MSGRPINLKKHLWISTLFNSLMERSRVKCKEKVKGRELQERPSKSKMEISRLKFIDKGRKGEESDISDAFMNPFGIALCAKRFLKARDWHNHGKIIKIMEVEPTYWHTQLKILLYSLKSILREHDPVLILMFNDGSSFILALYVNYLLFSEDDASFDNSNLELDLEPSRLNHMNQARQVVVGPFPCLLNRCDL
ncbi:hypothetical protein O6H91_08G099800 [Diphasiastrum complanatum]|uniref:Uncharacterized protein n=1 Tax=Diphasiastrum complanatum TaxID=34168 RepID=A0ACC2D0K0_DIPCM|nr:hypothetical protein O6H91_08G099800 [Diphasiastrum complanatum]